MKELKDRKSWAIAIIESFCIFGFNALFVGDIFEALGDHVSTRNVMIFSAATFVARILLFYGSLRLRLFLDRQ